MTGRQGPSSPRPRPTRTATLFAACTAAAVGASLLAGCGVLPGGSREPVTVMTWAPEGTKATNMPGMPAMAKTYARWVNAKGGLAGHELKVITCNERNTTFGAAACARQAVRAGAIAVVGSYSQHGRAFMAPLEVAGIPYIGGYGASDEEFVSPFSYPVNGGQATLLAGNGRQLARDCTRVALVRPDTIAGDDLPALLGSGLAEGGGHPATDIRAAEDASDYTAAARKSLKSARSASLAGTGTGTGKGCVTAVLGDRTETFFDSFRRVESETGGKVAVASVLGSVAQPLLDRTGGRNGPFEGAYVTGWYPVASDPRWDPMRKVIREHAFADNRIDPAEPGVQTAWIAYTVLKETVEAIGGGDEADISAADVFRTLNQGDGVLTGGLTPRLSWRFEDMLSSRDFPRIVNRDVTFQVVRQGRLVQLKRDFVDVGETLVRAPSAG
ncbi:ABC transporter substrate-binding protein [Streptomyces sp. H27-C3]|uniref:ABC transporter substrate-binding protein n=1 Tax=Streptomyces sp. H27-C3 TaxID=3046305 RepID=UPI0024BAC68D|nr:ABC transporter substrate-binding protein [Streptomyces sp. H27-C3]MDJ0466591.1 ABC transporter substrate-binding protein [Streptomyces sp. H27-C3]